MYSHTSQDENGWRKSYGSSDDEGGEVQQRERGGVDSGGDGDVDSGARGAVGRRGGAMEVCCPLWMCECILLC